MHNDPKLTVKATQELLKAKKCNVLKWLIQSREFNTIDYAFHTTRDPATGKTAQGRKLSVFGLQSVIDFRIKFIIIWECRVNFE